MSRYFRLVRDVSLRGSGGVIQVLTSLIVAKALGAEEAGQFFLGMTIAMVVSVLFRAGFDQVLTRQVAALKAKGREDLSREVAALLVARFANRSGPVVVTFAVIYLAIMWTGWTNEYVPEVFWTFFAAFPLIGLSAMMGCVYQGLGRTFMSVGVTFYCANFFVIGAFSLLPEAKLIADNLAAAFWVGSAIASIPAFLILASHSGRLDPELDHNSIDRGVKANAIAVCCNLAVLWLPVLGLGALAAHSEVARFTVDSRVAQIVSFILPALNFAAGPRFSSLHATGQFAALKKSLTLSVIFSMGLCSLVAGPLLLTGGSIVSLVGDEYAGGGIILTVLIVAQWINGGTGPVIQFLSMVGSERELTRSYIAAAVVMACVFSPLILAYGALGAAMTSLIGVIVLNALCLLFSFRIAADLAGGAVHEPLEA